MNQNWIYKAKEAGQHFEKPVSDGLWSRIHEDRMMLAKRKKIRIVRVVRASIAVAACLAAVVFINTTLEQSPETIDEQQTSNACVMYVDGEKIDDSDVIIARMKGELNAISNMSDIVK